MTSQAFIYSITNHKGRICPSFPAGMGTAGKKRALVFAAVIFNTSQGKEDGEEVGELEASNDAMEVSDEEVSATPAGSRDYDPSPQICTELCTCKRNCKTSLTHV